MKVSLPYARSSIDIEIPERKISAVLEPNEVAVCADPHKAVIDAVENPVGSGRFGDFLKSGGGLLVIVNDGTRPTPTRTVLEAVADRLEDADAEFIVATGAHRAPDEDELGFIFGSTLTRFRKRISSHDARNDAFCNFGTTPRGTEVLLNSRVRDAGRILVIGSVEPHYFAGYTGGRKGLLPGLAAYSTIEQNHRHALSPDSGILELAGNPVHDDMMDACRLVKKNIFTIMTVLDRGQRLHAVTAGDLEQAFDAAVEKAAGVFTVPFSEPADVVIACAKYPMDIDLYQSQKALENARPALKPGGSLILISACRDGTGDDAFSRLLSSCDTPDEVYRKIETGYKLGFHKAARIADLCSRARIMAFTGLESSVLKSVFMEPVSDLQKTLDLLLAGDERRVLIMPDASVTVPVLR